MSRGRPFKEDAKRKTIKMRVGLEELKMLAYLSSKSGDSYSDILRKGLRMQYNFKKYTENKA